MLTGSPAIAVQAKVDCAKVKCLALTFDDGPGKTTPALLDVLKQGHADAALAASIFHFGSYTVGQVKSFLAENDVPVRLA